MEAVPRLPMLSFALKSSVENPSFGPKLKQYIRDFYNEDPDAYAGEIHSLEGLRAQAVCAVRSVSGCQALKRYYCQLHFLQSRFPMAKNGAAAIPFTWQDTYTNVVCSLADIRFEMVCVLYNIGALHSQLGASDSRVSADGMKMCCTHFQCAAWAFQHLKDTYPQPAGVDLAPNVMIFMYHLMLAQAQECILEKSMMDNRKATIIAKVAVQVVDYFNAALNVLEQSESEECAVVDTVGSKLYKNWKRYVKFKTVYHSALSLLYHGQQAEEQQKMGERVAFYQSASDKLKEAMKLSKGMDEAEAVNEALAFTMDVIEGKKKAAKNENEFIYHEEVPERDVLTEVKGASLVKGIPFSVNDVEISGADIFARLVPMKAHEASSLYSEEKAKLRRRIGIMIDEKDQELAAFMSSLNLDYLNVHSESDALPQELVDRCAALSAKPNAIQDLIESMNKLSDTYQDVEGMLQDIKELLQSEQVHEKEYQEVMGKRPPSIVATDLTREANKYQEAHAKASDSNQTLHKAMTLHISNLRVLAVPLADLQQQIPTVAMLNSPADESSVKEIKHLVGKVDEMRQQRSMLVDSLRVSTSSDDITTQLVTRTGESLDVIFSQEMQKHQRIVATIEQNLFAQDNILKALTEAYARNAATRKATVEILRNRETTINALISSYDAYEDLLAKSSKGLEFYRKLETNVSKLLQRVKGTCNVQDEEREQILAKNYKTVPSSKAPQAPAEPIKSGPKLKDYLQSMKMGGRVTSEYPNPTPSPYYNPSFSQVPPAVSPLPSTYYDQSGQVPSEGAHQWVPSIRPNPVGQEGSEPSVSTCYSSNTATDLKADPKSTLQHGYSYPSAYPSYSQVTPSVPQGYPSSSTPDYNAPGYSQPYQPSSTTATYNSGGSGYGTDQGGNYQYQQGYLSEVSQPNASQSSQKVQGYMGVHSSHQTYPVQPNQQSTYPAQANQQLNYPMQTNQQTCYPAQTNQQTNNPAQTNTQPNYPAQTNTQPNYPAQTNMQPNYPTQTNTQPNYPAQTNTQPSYPTQTNTQPSYPTQTNTQPSYPTQTNQQPNYPTQTNQQPSYPNQTSQQSYSAHTIPTQPAYTPQQQQPSYPGQQADNLPSQTPASYYPTQQPYPTTSTPASSYSVQTDSYASHPGYSYNSVSGQYQYGSGYQSSVAGGYAVQQPAAAGNVWAAPGNNYGASTVPKANPEGDFGSYSTAQPSYPYGQTGEGYQYNTSAADSRYTSAGNNLTSQTSSTQIAVDGQTYSAQYNTSTTYESPGAYAQGSYYSLPYGYRNDGSLSTPPPSPQHALPQLPSKGPSTYMNAGGQQTSTTNSPSASLSSSNSVDRIDADHSSNVDLLAGLDFTASQAPLLTPQSAVANKEEQRSVKAVCPVTAESGAGEIDAKPLPVAKLIASGTLPVKQEIGAPNLNIQVPFSDEGKLALRGLGKDPYVDPETLAQFVADVEKYEKLVDGLTTKTLNGPTPLDIKWKELLDLQDKDANRQSISVARCYPMKNRFPDILPYDSSRVELPSTKDDYINASNLKNLTPLTPPFILTQAPLPSTYADFWTMIWEQQVEVIVCLLSNSELQEQVYWPVEKAQELAFGKLKLTLQSSEVRAYHVERIISVTLVETRVTRVIIHLQYTAWPGSSFPASPGPFLGLVTEALSYYNQQRGSSHPVVVHCLSGVGRTGLFCLVAAALCEIQAGAGLLDLVQTASDMSRCRKAAIRDREHLKFAYQAMLYYAQDMLMKIAANRTRSMYEKQLNDAQDPTSLRSLPHSGSKGSSVSSSGRSSPVNNSLVDFSRFSFKQESRKRYTKESFKSNRASSVSSLDSSSSVAADPLSQLDPLWQLK